MNNDDSTGGRGEGGRRRGSSTPRPVDLRRDLMYNIRNFMLCVVVPLAVTIGCVRSIGHAGFGGAEFWSYLWGAVGGLLVAVSYLSRYFIFRKPGAIRAKRILTVLATVVWVGWLIGLLILWLM